MRKEIFNKSILLSIMAISFISCSAVTPQTVRQDFINDLNNMSDEEQIKALKSSKKEWITQSKVVCQGGGHCHKVSKRVPVKVGGPSYYRYIKNPSLKVRLALGKVDCFNMKKIDNVNEDLLLKAIQSNSCVIQYIDNPSEEVQLAAVQKDPGSIQYITNPSKKIQRIAIEQNPNAILYIKNPSEDLQRLAITKKPSSIQYIKNPSKNLLKLALSLDPSTIEYTGKSLNDLSYEQQKRMILINPDKIKDLKNPSDELQILAVTKKQTVLSELKNPSEKVQLAVVRNDPKVILYLKNPSEKIQISAIQNNPNVIKYIKEPTEKVQLLAIKKDPSVFIHIHNPTEKVKIAAVQKDPSLIKYIKNPTKEIQILAGKTIEIPFRDYMPNYSLSNKDIAIKVENGKLTVTNNTKEFMQVISLSEYLDKDIFSYNPFKVSPDGIYTVNIARLNTLKLNKLRNRILFGYAIEYKVGNKPAKNLYKTFDYIYTIKGNDIYIKRAK